VTVDQSLPYTITGAPRAANGLVYIGNGGAAGAIAGAIPDLLKSAALQSAEAWRDLVHGGQRIALGMPDFERA
jgi:hypothetical protein